MKTVTQGQLGFSLGKNLWAEAGAGEWDVEVFHLVVIIHVKV